MTKQIKDIYISKEIAVYDHGTGENDVTPEFCDFVNKHVKKGYILESITHLHGEKINIEGRYVDGSHIFVVMKHKKSIEKLSL